MNGKTIENGYRDSPKKLAIHLTARYGEGTVFCGRSRSVATKPHRYPSNAYGLTGKQTSPAPRQGNEALAERKGPAHGLR